MLEQGSPRGPAKSQDAVPGPSSSMKDSRPKPRRASEEEPGSAVVSTMRWKSLFSRSSLIQLEAKFESMWPKARPDESQNAAAGSKTSMDAASSVSTQPAASPAFAKQQAHHAASEELDSKAINSSKAKPLRAAKPPRRFLTPPARSMRNFVEAGNSAQVPELAKGSAEPRDGNTAKANRSSKRGEELVCGYSSDSEAATFLFRRQEETRALCTSEAAVAAPVSLEDTQLRVLATDENDCSDAEDFLVAIPEAAAEDDKTLARWRSLSAQRIAAKQNLLGRSISDAAAFVGTQSSRCKAPAKHSMPLRSFASAAADFLTASDQHDTAPAQASSAADASVTSEAHIQHRAEEMSTSQLSSARGGSIEKQPQGLAGQSRDEASSSKRTESRLKLISLAEAATHAGTRRSTQCFQDGNPDI